MSEETKTPSPLEGDGQGGGHVAGDVATNNAPPPSPLPSAFAKASTDKQGEGEYAAAPQMDLSKRTTGEKYYNWLRFGTGEAFILAATAAIAYWARYGEKKWYNVFKHAQDWFERRLEPVARLGDTGKMLAEAAAVTTVTVHGGNLFAPIMKWFESRKEKIAGAFNRYFGEPGEEEIGRERLKREPEQSWGDVVKGRLASWAIVFASFFSADVIGKKTGLYDFDRYVEKFGKWVTGLSKDGKAILQAAETTEGLKALEKNKTYRFGKILALDIYATTAALMIWGAISKFSAKKRKILQEHSQEAAPGAPPSPAPAAADEAPEKQNTLFADRVGRSDRAAIAPQKDFAAAARQNASPELGLAG